MHSIRPSFRIRRARRPAPRSPECPTRPRGPTRERLRAKRKAEVESPPLGGHRGGRSREIVRRPPGVPRDLVHGRARGGFRPARAERRRQDHHAPHARGPLRAGRRRRARRRVPDHAGPSWRTGAAGARRVAHGVPGLLRPADRAREPHVLRAPAEGARARPPVRRLARSIRSARARGSPLRRAVARDEAEARHRPRAGSRSGRHPARRADRRARSGGDPGGAQRRRSTGGGPRDHRPLHASSRGGRAPLFPRGVHRRTAGRDPRDPPPEPAAHRARGALRAGRRAGPLSFPAALGEHAVDRAARRGAGDRRRAGPRRSAHRGGRSASRSARRCLAAAAGGGAGAMIGVVIRKELLEVRRSPILLLSMASLPATVVAVPIALLAWLVRAAPEQALLFVQDVYGVREAAGVAAGVASVLARNWLPMFLVLPIFLAVLLAAQSIGGERERRTLGPLLAPPVRTPRIVARTSEAAMWARCSDREKLLPGDPQEVRPCSLVFEV